MEKFALSYSWSFFSAQTRRLNIWTSAKHCKFSGVITEWSLILDKTLDRVKRRRTETWKRWERFSDLCSDNENGETELCGVRVWHGKNGAKKERVWGKRYHRPLRAKSTTLHYAKTVTWPIKTHTDNYFYFNLSNLVSSLKIKSKTSIKPLNQWFHI